MFSITLLPYSDLNGVCNKTKWAKKKNSSRRFL